MFKMGPLAWPNVRFVERYHGDPHFLLPLMFSFELGMTVSLL